MARRGSELREHILRTAKDVFIETGFERTSMDMVAARAATSKRSLYAHFKTKDKLFLAVIELVRELYLDQIKTPGHYADTTVDAVVLFCARFLQILLWTPVLRTCRLCIAEADRLPQASAQYYDTYFTATHERLAEFVAERCQLHSSISINIAHELLALTVYPRFARALFGVEETLTELPDATAIAAPLDLAPIRKVVTALLSSTEVAPRS